ncbi:septum formation protein Maf [Roseovarius faecimaris]|uniref:Nucleoside triphosphate pyrophosphatase n=1 Tax=Roseovarius faecimaris TaxID=2494550 RepID=A0A6I6J5U7_9RHOB|nr:Maf family nucleotide pyrophosphatase [Roseovarius faecimaris]QGY00149.1 septum formation protein Maf [Roseovarius faecimaris]
MSQPLILASGSEIRQVLLRNAGLAFEVEKPRVDEETVRHAMQAEGAPPRDVADMLAELKAQKVSAKFPAALVIGCDQVLAIDGEIFAKPETRDEARAQLEKLRGAQHRLISAAVICEGGRPVWRKIGVVKMTMRDFSDAYLDAYLDRNWDSIQHSVGAYKLEEEGVRLFERIDGDYFTVLGLPLLELLWFLGNRGVIET